MDDPSEFYQKRVRLESGPHTPLLYLLFPLIGGFVLGNEFAADAPPWPMLVLAAGLWALAALISSRLGPKRSLYAWGAAFCLSVAIGGWTYYSLRIIPPPDTRDMANREAIVELEIMRVFATRSPDKRLSGIAAIVTPPEYRTDFEGQLVAFSCWTGGLEAGRGALIRIKGKLEPTSGVTEGFDAYLRQQGCYLKISQASLKEVLAPGPSIYRWFAGINERWQEILRKGAESPRTRELSGIATAMLLGEKSALGREEKERFIASGTMHLFAVSGLHVGIVAGLLAVVLAACRVPRLARPIIGLILLLGYVQVTGAAPSAVRAWWMAFFFWTASALLRKPAPLSALVASALVVLVIDPRQLWSAGFQLSYTVVAGLLLFGVPLHEWLTRRFEPWQHTPDDRLQWSQRLVRNALLAVWGLLAISLAASLFSAPLTVRYFGVLAPGSFLLNMPLVVLAPLAMTASLVAVVAGTLGLGPVAVFANQASWIFIAGMDGLVRLFLAAPETSFTLAWRWSGMGYLLALGMLAAALALADRRTPVLWRFGAPPALLLVGLVFAVRITHSS